MVDTSAQSRAGERPASSREAAATAALQEELAKQSFDRLGIRSPQTQSTAINVASALSVHPEVLTSGDVKAIVNDHVETVGAANLAASLSGPATFFVRSGSATTNFTLPETLRSAVAESGHGTPVKLGYTFVASGGPGKALLQLHAIALSNTGLVFDSVHADFRGEISVALTNLVDPGNRQAPDVPVVVSVSAQGASKVDPTPLSIPDVDVWHKVSLVVASPSSPYTVLVSADPHDHGDSIEIAVSHPAVQLVPSSMHVIGWGIGIVPVAIRAQGFPHLRVTLQTERGTVSPNVVELDDLGNGTASLRSDSAPLTVLRVGDSGITSVPVTIAFDPPWFFLLAAILGGLLGAFLRGKGRERWGAALAIGVASAVLMTVMYAVGVDWASRVLDTKQLATSGEAVVFVLGAVAAYLGVSALIRSPMN